MKRKVKKLKKYENFKIYNFSSVMKTPKTIKI